MQTDCALVLHLQDIIVHPSQYLLGFERWYTGFLLDPRLLPALMDILLEYRTEQPEGSEVSRGLGGCDQFL